MKIYFPDDPVKQEMLKQLVGVYKQQQDYLLSKESDFKDVLILMKNIEVENIIEKATGEKIEEVLKWFSTLSQQ